MLELLCKTASSVVVNLLGAKLASHPGHLAELLPSPLVHRERTGRGILCRATVCRTGVTDSGLTLRGPRNLTCLAAHEDVFGAPGHQLPTAE